MAEKTKKQANPAVVQTVKAIATLVIICLVCVAILALLNDVLYVAPPSLDDAMSEIHSHEDGSGFVRDTEFDETLNSEYKKKADYGEILSIARCSVCGEIILEAISTSEGYQGGTVTLYVVVSTDAKIQNWSVKDNVSQNRIGEIPSNAGSTWYHGSDITAEIDEGDFKITNVTKTSDVINRAINMAAYYCRTALNEYFGLGEIKDPVQEAQNAVLALLSTNGYNYSSVTRLTSVQSVIGTALDTDTDKLTYLFVGEGAKGKIYAYVYGQFEEMKIVIVTETEVLTDNVEEADLVELIESKPIQEITVVGTVKLYTFISDISGKDEGAVEYVVTGIKLGDYIPDNYTLKVTIKDGVVTGIDFDTEDGNGFVDGWPEEADANALMTGLIGATLSNIGDKYDEGIVDESKVEAGATQSGNIITAAVKAALQDYDDRYSSNN